MNSVLPACRRVEEKRKTREREDKTETEKEKTEEKKSDRRQKIEEIVTGDRRGRKVIIDRR